MHRIAFTHSPTDPVTVDDLLPTLHTSRLQYNVIDADVFEDIIARDSVGQFGSKIQTLVKHLLYLKEHKPGSKSICFSAWSDSLAIVSYALEVNGILYLRMEGTKGRVNPVREFQMDPKYQVLLLHGYAMLLCYSESEML